MFPHWKVRRASTASLLALCVLTGASIAGAQASPMAFYGQTLPPDGTFQEQVVIVARNNNTTYRVLQLRAGMTPLVLSMGTLAQLSAATVNIATNIPIKVETSDTSYVYLGYDCCNYGGQWHMPASDGRTFVGREFVLYRPVTISGANQLNIIAHEAATVTIRNAMGAMVAMRTLAADGVWTDPAGVNARTVYTVTSTGNVTVAMGTANGFNVSHAIDSPLSSCNTDIGRRFTFPVNQGGYTGAFALFNYGSATANVRLAARGGAAQMLTVAANSYLFRQPTANGIYDVTSDQPLSVWGGTLEGGTTIDAFGDDVSQAVGDRGLRFFARSLEFPTVVFASTAGTRISGTSTVGMTATPINITLNQDEFATLPRASDLRITSNRPVSLMTRGGLAGRNDLGTWLRPIPSLDTDGDTILDVDEGGGCGSSSPDTDRDGTPDYLDLDSDGDGLTDAREAGDTDLSTPPVDTDGDGVANFRDTDDDNDTIPTTNEFGPGGAMTPRDSDMDGRADYLDPDDDNDTVPTANELGGGGFMTPRNTDGTVPAGSATSDALPDFLDSDDDGDGILTSMELGAGGFMTPQNSNAAVPMGQGTANATPDYLDRDDDGDSIPTLVERRLEAMGGAPDADMIAAYLDRDSDGDGFFDVVEAGMNPIVPANTDSADRPDFLDADSDNDCAQDAIETAAGRTNPALPNMVVNNNCPAMAPVCNTTTGTCVPTLDTDMDGIPDMNEYGPGGMGSPRDSDMDGIPDFRDPDDDGDGVLTRDELGAGGFMAPRNSDATVPAGEGASDATPDYLDTDDDGDGVPTRVERGAGAMPIDTDMDGAFDYLDRDDDNDTQPTAFELGAGGFMAPRNSDATVPAGEGASDTIADYLDADDDGDGMPSSRELGAGGYRMPQDTDGDMTADVLDRDDDGDTVPTARELGPGGAMAPQNTNAMVPMSEGTANMIADYLDVDDDGDGIPTRVEVALEMMGGAPDSDMIAAYLDRDSDGDGVTDRVEAGATLAMPVNTDAADRPDFLDTDSDNDCVADNDMREAGAARTNPALPSMMADNNCAAPTPVCDTTRGVCVGALDTDMDGIPDTSEYGPGGMGSPRDSDMDGIPDFRDPDDDGDGVLTRDELGPMGFASPRNSDATVPAGEGASDTTPDYLDPDDDGDGIPTRTENTLESMGGAPDMDMVPAYLDRDSDGDSIPDAIERGMDGAMPRNSDGADRPDFLDTDDDNDTILTADEARLDTSAGDDFDGDGTPSYLDTDSDGDALLDAAEGTMDRNMNMRPDFLDPADDSDADGVRDMVERGGCMGNGPNCVNGDRDTDGDMIPNYLDPDDDGDGIPTRTERELDPSTGDDFDRDGTPSYLDVDSDGDMDLDREEAGADATMPANTDRASDGPDFLDTDSDNDCLPDDARLEDGSARVMAAAMPDSNCNGATPVCDTSAGRCVACLPATMMGVAGRGCESSAAGRVCLSPAMMGANFCGCGVDTDCPMGQTCDVAMQRCTGAALPDAGAGDASAMNDGSARPDSGRMDGGNAAMDGGDAGSTSPGVLSGDGACACRVPSAPTKSGERAVSAMALLAAVAFVRSARRKR